MRSCAQCGAAVKPDAKFCEQCGASVASKTASQFAPPGRHPSRMSGEGTRNAPPSHLSLALEYYTKGEYEKAIPLFQKLLTGEQVKRTPQLYWLLANMKCHGIRAHLDDVAKLLQWRNFTAEEKPLAKELFFLAGGESLKKNDLTAAEQYFLRARFLSPSQDVASMLAVVQARKGEQARMEGHFTEALTDYQRAVAHDPRNETYRWRIPYVRSR